MEADTGDRGDQDVHTIVQGSGTAVCLPFSMGPSAVVGTAICGHVIGCDFRGIGVHSGHLMGRCGIAAVVCGRPCEDTGRYTGCIEMLNTGQCGGNVGITIVGGSRSSYQFNPIFKSPCSAIEVAVGIPEAFIVGRAIDVFLVDDGQAADKKAERFWRTPAECGMGFVQEGAYVISGISGVCKDKIAQRLARFSKVFEFIVESDVQCCSQQLSGQGIAYA